MSKKCKTIDVMKNMDKNFTLEYWIDDDWYIGKLREIPVVFSQGETLEELEENIIDAYMLLMDDNKEISTQGHVYTKDLLVEI
jgi:predicted RNase H-like HicB family nuclease